MKKKIISLMCALSLTGTAYVQADVAVQEPAPDFTLTDTTGKTHTLSDYRGKYVILEWINFDCPFVKKHYQSGNMQSLQKDLTSEGVVWLSINTGSPGKQGYYPPEEVNEILNNADATPTAYLYDDGEVGKLYGAKTTPHMYIIDPEGTLIYQGAIDDQPTFDPADIAKANNYVVSAFEAARASEPIAQATTTPYGCSVKY